MKQIQDGSNESLKPLAVGLEMPQGRWILEADGTLHFFGGTFLPGGGFSSYRMKVRRIVIDDFLVVGDGLFQYFNRCEEVILNRSAVSVGSCAFAHCHKLERVIHSEGWETAEDAFLDTPYQAEVEGRPFLPIEDRQRLIAAGPVGRRFIDSLHDELECMRTLPATPGPSRYTYDDRSWFSDSVKLLQEGFVRGEGAMMYLYARCVQQMIGILGGWDLEDYMYDLLCPGMDYVDATDWVMDHSDEIIQDLFKRAADGGSVHAVLWVAYCLDKGIPPFPSDHQASQRIAQPVRGRLETLSLDELSFLRDEFLDLVEEAYDADREEDEIGDQHGFRTGEYEYLLPNPDWRTLHLRYIDLAYFILFLGLPYFPISRGYDYQWPNDYDKIAGQLASRVADWEEWCAEKEYI